ncbi:kelch-like protein 26 [Arctopsyche grandis]|uniref:kelch-like protein 26 n=1 Tax=Arctopsyche grandis TaxID=121162 RepID=UPI00406D936B
MCDTTEIAVDEDHLVKVWGIMYEFMMKNNLCDVEVQADGQKFWYHSIVLASSSEHLNIEFTEGQKNEQIKQINIPDKNVVAVQRVFEFCYTGKIELKKDSVKDILSVANFIRLRPVIKVCFRFMLNTINLENCLSLFELGKLHSYELLETKASEFIGLHFKEVSRSANFLTLDIIILRNLIEMDNIGVNSENEIFAAVKRWIQYDNDNRKQHIESLMELVRLALLPLQYLFNEVQPFCSGSLKCQQLILEAIQWQTIPTKRAQLSYRRTRPRFPLKTIMIAGGWNGTTTQTIEIYNVSTGTWKKYAETRIDRNGSGVGLMGDELMFIGGKHDAVNIVESINLITGKKTTLQPLQNARVFPTVIGKDDKFYVFGGSSTASLTGRIVMDSVEIWNSITKIWSYGTPMITGRYGCGGALLGNEFFVVGGGTHKAMDVVEAYCFATGKWRQCASMITKRCVPGVATLNGYLYAVGGIASFDPTDQRISSVERYDPVTDTWTIISNISSGRYSVGAGALGNDLIVIGGADGSVALSLVELYDVGLNKWKNLESPLIPRELMCVLNVPVSYLDHTLV